MTTSPTPARRTTSQRAPRQTSRAEGEPAALASPELQDRFTLEIQAAQEERLWAEHQAQLDSLRQLSQGRIAAMMTQLQTQLFALWNDVWQQRRKAHDEAFKAWLKLLAA